MINKLCVLCCMPKGRLIVCRRVTLLHKYFIRLIIHSDSEEQWFALGIVIIVMYI